MLSNREFKARELENVCNCLVAVSKGRRGKVKDGIQLDNTRSR